MSYNRLHRVFLYSFAICLFVTFVTIAAKLFPIANLPTSTNIIIIGTCLANLISVAALIVGILLRRPVLVKAVKIFSYVQLGAIFILICLALFLLYVVRVDVQHYDEKVVQQEL
ncbi:uncharacterized protein LOC131689861 [Topomyia yanbarensis]|uniref:uncharacterized protein LOC131689861 n=1 Tax=Topomyia yanbarensis TaxID=2498891 RepID=UPI00273C77E5|nr:uncharacterized protein LOC131689861 [Topomyia yanbarensis]